MPAVRSTKSATTQLTLTGKPAPPPKASSSKSKLAPNRVDTDAVLCILPKYAQLIASREKNHEYRKYTLRDTVARIWLYETEGVSAINYVMETSNPKTPGQVQDPTGIGNDDFDNGLKQSKYGYPVLGLYKLKTPLRAKEMKSKLGITPPQGYMYATKNLVEAYPLSEMEKIF